MRGVCQLNLETATILNGEDAIELPAPPAAKVKAAPDPPPVPLGAAPRPIRPEELLATAKRGLEAATRRPRPL